MSIIYPYIDVNPNAWPEPTGEHQATATTAEDYAAISSVYPNANFASVTGTISGTVTYPFSNNGINGLNIVARNIDNPYEDAITAMTGDWNDGEPGATQGEGEFTLQGLTPGARYVVHVEAIFAGGFPTPQAGLPGPSEYWNGSRENDDATRDDACDYEEIVLAAGEVRSGIDIAINGLKKAPTLVINPAPDVINVTESGQTTGGTISNNYGEALSWIHHEGRDEHTILPMGAIRLSDNGSTISGRVIEDGQYLPARMVPGKRIEVLPTPGNNLCDQGGGTVEYYNNSAISPNGEFMGGFLWNCDDVEDQKNFVVSAVTYSDADGWTAVDGSFGSFKLTLDQLWVCRNGKSKQVGYPGGVAQQLDKGASLGMCEHDLPLQYKGNY